MKLESHNICLWGNGKHLESKLIDLLKSDFINKLTIVSLKYYSIENYKDQISFCKNIYYNSETDFTLKVNRCNFKNFVSIEVKLNSTKGYIQTTRGISYISKEIFYLKEHKLKFKNMKINTKMV